MKNIIVIVLTKIIVSRLGGSKVIMKCGMKLLIHSQTSSIQTLKFANGEVIHIHFIMEVITYPPLD